MKIQAQSRHDMVSIDNLALLADKYCLDRRRHPRQFRDRLCGGALPPEEAQDERRHTQR